MRVLIADDDRDLVEGLQWYLEAEGYQVLIASDGPAALQVFRAERPEVVILDIMMPQLDGVQVCEAIRTESDAFVMMLSARSGELDIVRALHSGADDYVTKPFFAAELVARIKALLRRAPRKTQGTPNLHWQGLHVYLEERRVTVNGAEVHLSSAEFDLLAAFLNRPRVVFSRNQLVDVLWGDAFYGELRLVDNHVYRLREKLTAAGLSPCPIVTIRGVGYAFRPDE